MTEITVVRNDQNFYLEFQIRDSDGNIVNLDNVTSIKLKYRSYSGNSLTVIDGEVTNPSAGECRFLIQNEFVGITGEFKGEIEITYSNGKVITAPYIVIKVIPDIS